MIFSKIPTTDALANCRGSEAPRAKEAYAYGRKLEQRWVRARTGAERASIKKEADLLSHGLHPKFPGCECEEILEKELTCDQAYTLTHVPTRDVGIRVRCSTRDVEPAEQMGY